jgi:hypothetical protein
MYIRVTVFKSIDIKRISSFIDDDVKRSKTVALLNSGGVCWSSGV